VGGQLSLFVFGGFTEDKRNKLFTIWVFHSTKLSWRLDEL
jgi:hypothetical protein